jgi:integrase
MLGLSPDDIEWLRKGGPVVHVRRQVRVIGGRLTFGPPKGGRERTVPLAEPVKLALAAHLERYPAGSVTLPWGGPDGRPATAALIVTTPDGQAVGKNGFNRSAWRPALAKAGIIPSRTTGCHALRHYFASALLHHGVDIKAVSEYLGHRSAAFTLSVYVHLMPAADDRAREAVSAAWAGTPDGTESAQGGAR